MRMCGIYGIFDQAGKKIKMQDAETLSESMKDRGPDDHGVYCGNGSIIGMRRLSIIDLEGGHQPIYNEDRTIAVVLNGEIYNYIELRKDLLLRGHVFRTNSDVEVLIHLYEEYGKKCIQMLNGMFAFALYNIVKNEMWIARDRLGIKPLYYSYDNKKLIFSSELGGLSKLKLAAFSYESLLRYLMYSYIPSPETIYTGISKLLPGCQMVISQNKFAITRYWDIASSDEVIHDEKLSFYEEKLDSLLTDSVRLNLRSDVPVGIFLSGGVDSSAITYYSSKLGGDLNTFTIDFDSKAGGDGKFAKIVSETFSTKHHHIKLNALEQFNELDQLIKKIDEPVADSAIVPSYIIAKYAREQGIKVLLSGAGGDEIFGGYPRYGLQAVRIDTWLSTLPAPLRLIAAQILAFKDMNLKERISRPEKNYLANISGVNYHILKKSIRNKEHLDRAERELLLKFSATRSRSSAYPLMKLDLKTYLPDNILSLTDKSTMAASVECRVPLLDHRLVEFAFSIPESINILDRTQKGLFKKIISKGLPAELLNREKEGFNAPIHKWTIDNVDSIKNSIFEETSDVLSELVDVKKLWHEFASPEKLKSGSSTLYSLFVLNKWLNSH